MKKLILLLCVLAPLLIAQGNQGQNQQCSDRPAGDSTNACANTRFSTGIAPGTSVRANGAKCNAVEGTGNATGNDDFPAFVRTITQVSGWGGGVVYLSAGSTNNCLWKKQSGNNPTLVFPSNVSLVCAQGTQILVEGTPNGVNGYTTGAVINSNQIGGNTNISINGCTFKASGPTQGSVFAAFKRVNGGSFTGTRFLDNNGSARAQLAYTSNFDISNYYVDYASSTPWTKVLQANQSIVVSGAANNGSGAIRLTVASTATFTTGNRLTVAQVGGTTEANGNWLITKIDGTHVDLQGSTFTHTYTSGGIIGNITGYEDGLRISSGSHNITVNGCVINSGDDAIALNNEPSETGGSTTGADIYAVTVNGCAITTRNGNAIRVYQEATMIAGVTHAISFNGITGAPTHYADNGISLRDNSGRRAIYDIDYNAIKLNFAGVTGTSAIEAINTDKITFTGLSAAVVTSFGLNANDARRTSLVNSQITGATADNVGFYGASTASSILGGYYAGAGRDNIHVENTDDVQIGGARLEAPTRRNIGMTTALRTIVYNNRHISSSLSPVIQEDTGSDYSVVYVQEVDGVTTGIDTSTAGTSSCYFIFPCVGVTKLSPSYGGIGTAVGINATATVRNAADSGSCTLTIVNGIVTATTC